MKIIDRIQRVRISHLLRRKRAAEIRRNKSPDPSLTSHVLSDGDIMVYHRLGTEDVTDGTRTETRLGISANQTWKPKAAITED